VLSVLGCPNLHLGNVLQSSAATSSSSSSSVVGLGRRATSDRTSVSYIEPSVPYPPASSDSSLGTERERHVFSPAAGSLYFAVTGLGAFARSLSQPLGAGFEVQVSGCRTSRESRLCESSEASHGDRSTTLKVFASLDLQHEFIHLDGQCKYCVVGAGGAEGNMRLPPEGYVEKVWDHVPGGHFIMEAGGEMTDLSGQRLDFSRGRVLSTSVTGILASNSIMHTVILEAITQARKKEDEEVGAGKLSRRPKEMN
jgi:3'(2'), 5'-bisphosphate nucleotidase